MKLYSNGVDITGGYVKLTDRIILTIELDEEYRSKFIFFKVFLFIFRRICIINLL